MNLSDGTITRNIDLFFPREQAHNSTIDVIDQVQPGTIDLRLGRRFWVMKMGLPPEMIPIDPAKVSGKDYMTEVVLGEGEHFVMRPGPENFVLAETMEWIEIPDGLQAEVDGKSTWGRHGLVIHSTAGVVDAGFKGVITLELSLTNRYPIILRPGEKICQVKFVMLDAPAERPYGHSSRRSKYQGQTGAVPSLSNKDGEIT